MNELNTKTIREIALRYPQTTKVFEQYKIDYCCGGKKPLSEAVESAGLDLTVVQSMLEKAINDQDDDAFAPEKFRPSELIEYVVGKHHVFTRDALDQLRPLMDKVCDRHGESHKELYLIRSVLRSLSADLLLHMRKEEMVLFPYIESMDAVQNGGPLVPPHFMTVKNPVRIMIAEHDAAGDFLRQIREFSKDYTAPDGACPSFKALYFRLEELERDLHRHIHLENNVLFPQAVELESEVFRSLENPNSQGEISCSMNV